MGRSVFARPLRASAFGVPNATPQLVMPPSVPFTSKYNQLCGFTHFTFVTKVKWVNPHSWLYFDVKGTDGGMTNWGVAFGTPNALARKGLAKTDLPIGALVHVKGYRSKNAGAYGYSVMLILPDGRSFQ